MQKTVKKLRKIIIAILGFTVIIIGILLIVTPGPAIIVIPAGLTILATEFPWAEKLLAKIKSKLKRKKQTQN
jgi:uncharacterized protein (TIGR02611 family)